MEIFIGFMMICIPSIIKKNSQKAIVFVILSYLLFVGIIRYNYGSDYNVYSNYYNFFSGNRFESGFNFLISSLKVFSLPAQSFFIVTHLFISFSIFRFINKYSKWVLLSLFFYVAGFFFFDSLNIIRQYISLSIVLLFLDKFLDNKWIYIFIITYFAILFHNSAIVVLAYPFISRKRFSFPSVLIISLSTIVIYNIVSSSFFLNFINNVPFLSDYTSYFELSAYSVGALPFDFILYLLIYIFIRFFGKIDLKNKFQIFFENSMFISIIVKFLSLRFFLFDRFNVYFQIYTIVYLTYFLLNNKISNKQFLRIVFIILFVLYTIIRIVNGQAGVENFESIIRI